MGFIDRLENYQQQVSDLRWEGSFFDYLKEVKRNPSISQQAHARLYDKAGYGGEHGCDKQSFS